MEQLTKAFNFTLEGEQKLGPYDVYVLKATRRPGYVPPNRETRVLTGMEGRLWVDKKSYQWVKVEAHVIAIHHSVDALRDAGNIRGLGMQLVEADVDLTCGLVIGVGSVVATV